MATTLYLHSASTTDTGSFPNARHGGTAPTLQGGLTPWQDGQAGADAATVQRAMTPTIGTSQTSIAITTLANTLSETYYFCKWISPPLNQTSIAANTWAMNYAFQENSTSANFNGAIAYIYIWRPSTGTFVNWIVDQINASDTLKPASINTERAKNVTVTGSSAICAVGDVIIWEFWTRQQLSTAAAYTDTIFFDGATVNAAATNTIITDCAAYLQTPENLSFVDMGPQATSVTSKTVTNKFIIKV